MPAAAAESCRSWGRLAKSALSPAFELWAKRTKEEADIRGAERFKDPTYKHFLDSYDAMIKAGIAPTDRVPEEKLRVGTWSGTVLELRQRWCDKPR